MSSSFHAENVDLFKLLRREQILRPILYFRLDSSLLMVETVHCKGNSGWLIITKQSNYFRVAFLSSTAFSHVDFSDLQRFRYEHSHGYFLPQV